MKHRAKRRDANEPPIVQALERAGATVQRLDTGEGCPDLLVGIDGRTLLLEVKNPDAKGGAKYNTGGRWLTKAQAAWFAAWKGQAIVTVSTADEALRAIGATP